MTGYEIRIDVDRLLHYSEVLKPQINNETLLMLLKEFSVYIRNLYLDNIELAMNSRRYRGEWEPVSEPEYLSYIGTTPSISILEMIESAMEIRESSYDIVIRINPRYLYKGSKKSLLTVIRVIDSGNSDINARPIFKQIVRSINRKMLVHWRGFLRLRGKML